MAKVMSRAQKKQKMIEERLNLLVSEVGKFAVVDPKEKRISITHPAYDALKKAQRDLIGDLKLERDFYIQWRSI